MSVLDRVTGEMTFDVFPDDASADQDTLRNNEQLAMGTTEVAEPSVTASGDCGCGTEPAIVTAMRQRDPSRVLSDAPTEEASAASWSGVLVAEGDMTGDGRLIEQNALRWDDLPLPLRYAPVDNGAHDGAQVVGWIRTIERGDDGLIHATGDFDLDSEVGREAHRQVGAGLTPGVSVDLDDVSFEMRVAGDVIAQMDEPDAEPLAVDEEGRAIVHTAAPGDEIMVTTDARIRAATIVSIPAFSQARIELADDLAESDDPPLDDIQDDDLTEDDEQDFNWVDDVGGLPRYIGRIAEHLIAKGMSESHAIASAVNVVKRWCRGGGDVQADTQAKACAAVASWEEKKARANADAAETIVASGAISRPPSGWFTNPNLTGPTALTVTEEGRVYGHLATWGTCHIGSPGECVTPPHSATGYVYFHVGSLLTDEGDDLAVGRITLNTRHAGTDLAASATLAHYEHTGLAAADVRAGEDEHGIWVAGAVRSRLSDDDRHALKASPLSGDWRRIGGNLELVAALAVNTPGFPIPRPSGLVASGQQVSLVASGLVTEPVVTEPLVTDAFGPEDMERIRRILNRDKEIERTEVLSRARLIRARTLKARVDAMTTYTTKEH